eukprot:Hpha_TRINITY_DN16476_c3_g1::TRINITY_DN16476_c3_g1_i4::g.160537::m.160537
MPDRLSCCYRWLLHEGDTPMDIRIKRGITPLCYVFIPLGIFWTYSWQSSGDRNEYFIWPTTMSYVIPFIIFLIKAKLGHPMGTPLDIVLILMSFAALANDWAAVSEVRTRFWNLIVIVLDMALVFQRDKMIPVVL